MSIWHLIILLVVVVVIFGTGKLRHMGSDLGSAIRDFKKGLNSGEDEAGRKSGEQLRADPPPVEPAKPAASTPDQRDPSEHK